jgi:hypothetical protein
MPTFTKTSDGTLFNFDDFKNVSFDRFVTDSDSSNGYYEIEYYFNIIEKGSHLFSFYHYSPVAGSQAANFWFQISVGDLYVDINNSNRVSYGHEIGSLVDDKNGIPYPSYIRRIYIPLELQLFDNKITFKLISSKFVAEGLKTSEGIIPFFNPKGVSKSLYIFGPQLERTDKFLPSDFSSYSEISNTNNNPNLNLRSRFEYFIHKLYGLEGEFVKINNAISFFQANDLQLKEERRLNCGEFACWQSKIDSNPDYNTLGDRNSIYRYKNTLYEQSDLYIFFRDKIDRFLTNILENDFPKLYTDFDKLYFVGQQYNFNDGKIGALQKITYEKTDPSHGNAIKEIIDILTKYKSFDYKTTTTSQFEYKVPIPYPGDTHTAITNEDLDNIIFTGFLSQSVDLNIQAGFCRYYLNPETPKPKVSGYFYETNNFFDVKNNNLVTVQNNTVSYINIFPNNKPLINQRPYLNIVDIKSLNFSRLTKNDLSVDFTKTLNYIGYVGDCYYKELKTGVEVQLIGVYTTNRKMSDVWKIEILDTLESIPSYSSPEDTPIGQKTYEVKDFGDKKTGFSESKYLKIIHKNMEVSNAFLEDRASITLTSSLGTEEYKSYKSLL